MHGVGLVGDCIEIGAAVTHRAVETDDLIGSRLPSVADYVSALRQHSKSGARERSAAT